MAIRVGWKNYFMELNSFSKILFVVEQNNVAREILDHENLSTFAFRFLQNTIKIGKNRAMKTA